jgi:hypothetical protein
MSYLTLFQEAKIILETYETDLKKVQIGELSGRQNCSIIYWFSCWYI